MLPRIELFARNYRAAEPLYSELAKGETTGGIASYGGMSSASALGRIRQALGDEAGARTVLLECLTREKDLIRSSKNAVALYRIAAIEASLGDVETSTRDLQSAVDAGWINYRSLQLDPRFDKIASDPRFPEIISALTTKVSELRRQTGQPLTMAANGEKYSP
jgi:hypothetical protein